MLAAIKSSRVAQLGLLGIVAGFDLLAYASTEKVPERASLEKVAGVLAEGKAVSRTSRRRGQSTGTVTTVYELTVRDAAGKMRKLDLDGGFVTRQSVEAAMGQNVVAEVHGGNTILALQSGSNAVLTYENSAKSYDIDAKRYRDMGTPALILGLLLLPIGLFLGRRRKTTPTAPSA